MLNRDFSALGTTVHWVTPGLDQGRILAQKRVFFTVGDTPATLREKTNEIKPMLFDEALRKIISGEGEGVEQDEAQATQFKRPTPEDVERFKKIYP
jgi:methionyl-tRNA formyltransferase